MGERSIWIVENIWCCYSLDNPNNPHFFCLRLRKFENPRSWKRRNKMMSLCQLKADISFGRYDSTFRRLCSLQLHFCSFTLATSLLQLHYCNFTIAISLLELHYCNFSIAASLLQLHYCNFAIASSKSKAESFYWYVFSKCSYVSNIRNVCVQLRERLKPHTTLLQFS